jgi:flagellar motility protein MotE (MotC chaperone)
VDVSIEKDRKQQQQLEKEISRLAEQLQVVSGELNSRIQLRSDIDQSIEQAEDAFNKVHSIIT